MNATNGYHTSFWSMGMKRNLNSAFGDPRIAQDMVDSVIPEFNQLYEIDGFESDSPDVIAHGDEPWVVGTIKHRTNIGSVSVTRGIDVGTWNLYSFEYTPTSTKFYINDQLQWTNDNTTNGYAFTPQNFWLTSIKFKTTDNPSALNRSSDFDYFRYYNKPLINTNLLGNGSFDAVPTGGGFLVSNPPAWLESYDKTNSALVSDVVYDGGYSLFHSGTAAYQVTTKQNLQSIPNGTYKLTAYVKSSGGQSQARMRVLGMGGAELKVDIPASNGWTLITISNIPVTNKAATIAFSSTASANQWIRVDNVKFVQTS